MRVVTRFAPSPTGMLHIGGARTALFNYLFARHHGGTYKLRIEDTDKKRSTPEAVQALLDGLAWLGVPHDGDPIFQSTREARHREVAEELVRKGAAYYCYTTLEELAEQRKTAEANGAQFTYDRKWRDSTATPPAGVAPSIRIKAPLTGEVVVRDAVQGDVRFAADVLDDFVILRSDGTPTYMHAVVVDDHDMEITHAIRGDDHLNNAGRQMLIYQAMGWQVPVFAHIPLIHGPDGAKLSKRHGATSVTEYAAMGYVPQAMRNYLIRLGWAHGDDEIFSDAQAAEWFTLEAIGQSPSRLDFAKLAHINAHYLRAAEPVTLAPLLTPFLPPLTPAQHDLLLRAIPTVYEKASTLIELAKAVEFYLIAPTSYSENARKQLAKGREHLTAFAPYLAALNDAAWNDASITDAMHRYAVSITKEVNTIMPVLRAAMVGDMTGPLVVVAMRELGRNETLLRLKAALAA